MPHFSRNSRTSRSYSRKIRSSRSPYSLSPFPVRVKAEENVLTQECLMLTIEENGVNHGDEHFVAAPTSDIMKQELKVESIEIDQYDDDKGSVAAVHGGMDSEPGLRLFETLPRSVENKNLNSEAYRAFFRAYPLLLPGVLELEKTWWHVSKSYEKIACNREIYLL